MIGPTDRVQIWASQLAANDFPPVCAMTGRPAQTWRKFTFSTPPQWAYALVALVCLGAIGLILAAVVTYAVSERATGHLPLTRASSRTAVLAFWIPIGLIIASPLSWIIAIPFASDSQSGAFAVFFFLGLGLLFAGLLGRLVVTPLISPRGKVYPVQPGYYDRIVELRNISAGFVMTVRQSQQARGAQLAAATRPPLIPQ